MPSEPKRKLVAIMFTDMVGYTALMQDDEPKARELIQRHRKLMKPLIEKHGGIILQYVGDGTFITFDSAIEAVNCGYEVQNELKSDKDLSLRIGIHIGDIVVEGHEVYGDGVNVASRLEPLAEAGGICVSHQVYENIKNQPGIEAVLLGEKALKNVDHPIKIYSLAGKGLKVTETFEVEEKAVIESKEVDEVVSKTASKKLLPWLAGAVVLLILFFAKGWFSGESSITEVTADENSLAVLFIENMTDPADTDRSAEMIRMLLSTDLAQSHSLRIIGSQRLYDIAKQERKEGGQLIDRSNASAVARKAGAQWMLTGTLAKVGNHMVLVTEIENVKTGKVLDAQRADGNDLFSLVDALSSEIRSDMGVRVSAGEIDAPVKEITTYSAVAYQHYLGGLEFLNESNFSEAIEKLNLAVEIDSTFTKALYKLAVAQWWFYTTDVHEAKQTIKRIMIHKEKLTEGMRLLVDGLTANVNNDYTTAQGIYQRLLEKFPDEKEIYYGLGEAYYHGGGANLKALDAFERALELDPEFTLAYRHIFDIYWQERLYDRGIRKGSELVASNPMSSRGYTDLARMYRNKGEFDSAIDTYKKAIGISPENYPAMRSMGYTYRLMGKHGKAAEIYNELFKPNVPVLQQYYAKRNLSFAFAEQGRYREAIQAMEESRQIAESINIEREGNAIVWSGIIHYYVGDTEEALALFEKALTVEQRAGYLVFALFYEGMIHAIGGDRQALEGAIAEAQALIERAKDDPTLPYAKYALTALLAESFHLEGDAERALLELGNLRDNRIWSDWLLYKKAMILIEAHKFDQALVAANTMEAPDITTNSHFFNYPLAFYVRGRAYEEMSKPDLAIENYEALLELWKDADEGIPERRDTIKRLAALKQESSI